MSTFEEAVRAVQGTLGTKQNKIEWQPAMLGDGHGTVSTGNNMCYVRLSTNSAVVEVLNLRCAMVDGLRVRIAKTPEMPLVWQVIGQDDQRVDENGGGGDGTNYSIPLHHLSHEYLKSDQVNIDWRQITALRVYVSSAFTIGILAGLLPRPGADLVVATQTLDLTSHIPVGAAYALISVNSVGTIVATDGTPVASVSLLTLADIPDTPAGNFRLAAVRLYTGQAALSESTTQNDIRDLRWPQEKLAASVSVSDMALTTNHIIVGAAGVGADVAMSGDATIVAGGALTLNTVNTVTPGTFGAATKSAVITVNGKGLVTASAEVTITVPVGANPTASSTGVAINGAAATFMRSDAAFAIASLPDEKILLDLTGSPALTTLHDDWRTTGSSGVADGTLTYVTVGSTAVKISVAAGDGYIRATNDQQAELTICHWAASADLYTFSAPAAGQETAIFVGIEMSGGSAVAVTNASFDYFNGYDKFWLARVSYDGTTMRIINTYAHAEDVANNTRLWLRKTHPFVREEAPEGSGGLEVSSLLRALAMTAGNIWHGYNRYVLSALASGVAFDTHYQRAGGGFNSTIGVTAWPNTQYDNASGTLQDLTVNRYGTLWVYVDVSDGSLDMMYGAVNATSVANAQLDTVPTTPNHLTYHGKLIGRIIFRNGGASATLVESAWTSAFSASSVGDHALLTNLLGTSPYYHLPTPVAPAAALMNVAGIVNAETDWSNKPLFDSTAASDLAGTAAAGTSLLASHRDHVHLGLTSAQLTDLTDGGTTTLHTHTGGGGDISGTGVVGQVAEFVTDTKTIQAAKIIGPATNILTLTNAAASTLALAITSAKTLTLTAVDNFTLTIAAAASISGTNTGDQSGANPSASVGLAAVNGAAATFLRSDGAPALSQAIIPTWTGLHTFNSGVIPSEAIVLMIDPLVGPGGSPSPSLRLTAQSWTGSAAQEDWDIHAYAEDGGLNSLYFSSRENANAYVVQMELSSTGGYLINGNTITFTRNAATQGALSWNTSGSSKAISLPNLSGTVALTSAKLDDFATPDDNTDLDANTTNHGLLLKASAPAAGLYSYVGITNGETAYTNKALFDATVPTTVAESAAAAAGSAAVAARRDHTHGAPATWAATAHNIFSSTHGDSTGAASPVDGDVIIGNVTPKWSKLAIAIPAATFINTLAIANGELRPSWKVLFDATVPTTIAESAAAAAGTAVVTARRDHTHGAPATYAATAHNIFSATHGDSTGAASPVDGDVIIGNVTPKWSKLAIAIPAANVRNVLGIDNGELRPSWKTALDATAPATLTVSAAAAAGTSLVFSHRDHVHPITSSAAPGAAASLLATDSSGLLTLQGLTLTKNAAALPASLTGTLIQLGNANGVATRILLDAFATNTTISFRRANNTGATPQALAANDIIGLFAAFGYGATAYTTSSRVNISFLASQIWTDANQGGYMTVNTTPNNTTAVALAATFGQDQSLTVVGAFGCNAATARTAFASGGAAPAGGTGATAGAYDTAAHRDSLITLVNNIRTALVNNGIMS